MLNTTECGEKRTNTGFGDCPFDMKNIVSVFISKTPIIIKKADLATKELTIAALEAATLAIPKNRLYPINNIVGLDGNIEDAVTQTLGYGAIVTIKDGNYNLNLSFVKGGLCLSNALRGFNYTYPYALLMDANGVLVGTRDGEDLKSFPLISFYQKPFGMNDGNAAIANYSMNLVFDPQYINENIGFQIIGSATQINGLQDVILSETTGSTPGVVKLVGAAGCSNDNFLKDFYSELSQPSAVTLWVAMNLATGGAIDIISVAVSPTGIATVTMDTTDPDYPTVTGDFLVNLATPSVLSSSGISGFESAGVAVTFTQ